MTQRKPVPRAVLEERLKVMEERQERRRLYAVQTGVYFANVLGVLASQAIDTSRNLMMTLQIDEIGQLVGAMIVAVLVFAKTQTGKKDVAGMAKKGNVFRVLLSAFSNGFMWMTITGAWW